MGLLWHGPACQHGIWPLSLSLTHHRPWWPFLLGGCSGQTASRRGGGGGGGDSELQDGAAFGSYLCDAVSMRLIISLISGTRLPDGLERRRSSCLNWLQQRTWCCNYRGDWRQRLPLLIKDLTPASHIAVQWWEDSGSLPVSPIPLRPFQRLSVGSCGTQCGLQFFNSVSALLKLT